MSVIKPCCLSHCYSLAWSRL